MNISRRKFLKNFTQTAGCFIATASIFPLSSCTIPKTIKSSYGFPQGVASADPQPDAIMLWTRIEPSNNPEREQISFLLQVANDEEFSEIILEKALLANKDLDFTVRCFVDNLSPNRYYFYRFISPDGSTSRTGRTKTAPKHSETKPLNLAVFSCQHYDLGYFSAYRRLLIDDKKAPDSDKIDAILYVGDFIYEFFLEGTFTDLNHQAVSLKDSSGNRRTGHPFPSGGDPAPGPGGIHPYYAREELEDYRHLYRTYLSDPDLQEARAWYPFIYTWDDHEVLNDYWQSYHPSGPLQNRKVIGNKVWFEYMPAALTEAEPGPSGENPAHDLKLADVENVSAGDFDHNYLGTETNNMTAIGSLTIYRSLKWGTLVDLFMVDGRSYRGPRGVPEDILGEGTISYPDLPIPRDIVETLNAGMNANDGSPPDTLFLHGQNIENPNKLSPTSSLLGANQKDWLKKSLTNSTAKWKAIGNPCPMMQYGFDSSFLDNGTIDAVLWSDAWDGFPMERREMLNYIAENKINNVVSLSGDRHAHFAGLVTDKKVKPSGAIPEFAGAAVSARSRLAAQYDFSKKNEKLKPLVGFNGKEHGYDQALMPSLNAWLLYGADAARTVSETGDPKKAESRANPSVNPHMAYADNDAYGYYVARFNAKQLDIQFVSIPEPIKDYTEQGNPVLRRVNFQVQGWSRDKEPKITEAKVEGKAPFMGVKPI